MPGTLVDVFGDGVLLTGASGVGKSETALRLIDRGHRLVADDLVRIVHSPDHRLLGSAFAEGRGCLAVRELGILDLSRVPGESALAESAIIVLTIELLAPSLGRPAAGAPHAAFSDVVIAGTTVPRLRLTAYPGRPLALLVEHAVNVRRHHSRKESS